MSPKLRKMIFLHKKWLYFLKIQFLTKSSFAQALEKRNMSPKMRKMFFFAQKMVVIFSQTSVFDEIQFSQKSLINRKNQPNTLPEQVLVQQTPIVFCCYYKPPRSGPREAAVPEKETKIVKEGARGD